jgi:hypothetical protein
MVVNLHNLIAAINPDIYCSPAVDPKTNKSLRSVVKAMVQKALASKDPKEKSMAYLNAAKIAKPIPPEYIDIIDTQYGKNAFRLEGIKNPIEKSVLVYDDFSKNLEPIYYYMVDYLNK